jgi:hypothetical protein
MATETPEQIYARINGLEAPPARAADTNVTQQTVEAPATIASQEQDSEEAARERVRRGIETYRNLATQNPDEGGGFWTNLSTKAADNAVGVLGGLYAGEKFRKHLPENRLYDPNVVEIEKRHLPKAETKLGELHEERMNDLEARNELRNQHLEAGEHLGLQARLKSYQLEQTERELAEARQRYLASHGLEPEHFMTTQPIETIPTTTGSTGTGLTRTPLGGKATSEYALKFGATPEEAERVTSMSQMQKQNIPAQVEALERVKALSPNVAMTQESPLLLTPEAQKVVEERKAMQMQQQAQAQAIEERRKAEHAAAIKKVAQEKFAAEQEVKRLEKLREQHAKEHEKAMEKHEAHLGKAPKPATPTDEQIKAAKHQADLIDEMRDKVNQYYGQYGKYGQRIAKLGTKIFPRFVPVYGSAFAYPQAEAAKREAEKGNPIRSGIYGVGSVGALAQATGNPFLMGAGDILQAPAAALGAYDILSGNDE